MLAILYKRMIFASFAAFLWSNPIHAAEVFVDLPGLESKIATDSVNLTVKNFFAALTSQTALERERARLYLLGVEDATEHKSWCEYRLFKTITLEENIVRYFEKLPPSRWQERAASVIEEALHKRFPCPSTK